MFLKIKTFIIYIFKYYWNFIIQFFHNSDLKILKKHILFIMMLSYICFFIFTFSFSYIIHYSLKETTHVVNSFTIGFLAFYFISLTVDIGHNIFINYLTSITNLNNRILYVFLFESIAPLIVYVLALIVQFPIVLFNIIFNGIHGFKFIVNINIFMLTLLLFVVSAKVIGYSLKLIYYKYTFKSIKEFTILVVSILISLYITKYITNIIYVLKKILIAFIENNINSILASQLNNLKLFNYNYYFIINNLTILSILMILISIILIKNIDNINYIKKWSLFKNSKNTFARIIINRVGFFNEFFLLSIIFINIISIYGKKYIFNDYFILPTISTVTMSLFVKCIFNKFSHFIFVNRINFKKCSLIFSLYCCTLFLVIYIWGFIFNLYNFSLYLFLVISLILYIINFIYLYSYMFIYEILYTSEFFPKNVIDYILKFYAAIPIIFYSIIGGITYVI